MASIRRAHLAPGGKAPSRVPPRRVPPAPAWWRPRAALPRSWPLLLAAILAGCSVGPSYTRPTVPTPARWRFDRDTSVASFADVAWWRVFEDTVLHQLIRTALRENYDLGQAIERVRESRAQFVATRGAQFPQVNALAARVDMRMPNILFTGPPTTQAGGPSTIGIITGGLDVSYQVDLWGRLRQATRAARFQFRASESDRQSVITTVISDVAQAYFNLLQLDRVAMVTRRSIETRRASLALVRRKVQSGLSSDLDLRQAEQELAAAQAQLPGVERQIAQTEDQISILLGRNPGPVPRGTPLDEQALPPCVPVGLPSRLLVRRPDIRAAEMRVIAANATTRSTLAQFFPQISLTGAYSAVSKEFSELLDNKSQSWVLLSLVRVPVFHGGTLRGELDSARAQEAEAAIAYARTVQQAFREVNDALAYQRTAAEARASYQTQVVAARRALQLANVRYTEGLGTYLNVLDAERQLTSAEIDFASAIGDQFQAVVQLYKALGGGWDITAPVREGPP
ncbi:MAG TPA: efflux transporter outer membrane subunit [Longimicrobiales bacterium]|nr:efflux transporter outer membrane subunit [Longimicrobiales bacterium]